MYSTIFTKFFPQTKKSKNLWKLLCKTWKKNICLKGIKPYRISTCGFLLSPREEMKRLLSICHQMHHGWQIRSWQRWTRPILWALPFMWHFTPPSVKMLYKTYKTFYHGVSWFNVSTFSKRNQRSYGKYHPGSHRAHRTFAWSYKKPKTPKMSGLIRSHF